MREIATRVLGKQVRLAKPHMLAGLAEAVSGPAFSTAIGMLEYARRKMLEEAHQDAGRRKPLQFAVKDIFQWFKDNF
jgi:cell division protein FtsA